MDHGIKDHILSVSRPYRLHFSPPALQFFVAESKSKRDPAAYVDDVVSLLTALPTKGHVIGVEDLRAIGGEIYEKQRTQHSGINGNSGSGSGVPHKSLLWTLNASNFPRVSVDRLSGALSPATTKTFSSPYDAADQRLHFALERCMRSGAYQARAGNSNANILSSHGSTSSNSKPVLYSLSSLEGLSNDRMHIAVLGHLSLDAAEKQWFIEDGLNSVKVELATEGWGGGSITPPVGIVGDGSIAVLHGRWNGSVFRCDHVCLPPSETKEASRAAYRGINLFGGNMAPGGPTDDVLVIVSQCHFNRHQSLDCLRRVLAEFESREEEELRQITFALLGNFTSNPAPPDSPMHLSATESRGGSTAAALSSFATMVASYVPRVGANAGFVFVPGPDDDSSISGVLPQPPLGAELLRTTNLSTACPRAQFASNPCRMQLAGQEVTICRAAFAKMLLSAPKSIGNHNQPGDAEGGAQPFEHIVKTVVDSRHLMPLRTLRPRQVWGMDAALSLVTLPDLLVLADSSDPWECEYAGCKVLNPGSFSATTSFTWYSAADNETTFNQLQQLQ